MIEEQQKELEDILAELAENLDITETQDKVIRQSYEAVGNFLAEDGSLLAQYDVEIWPQGSFNLGTIIKPVNEGDDLDIDLVCELKSKEKDWTQHDVKSNVGKRLKQSDLYRKMLDDEGRRCWTLLYRDNAQSTNDKYHMDILPSIVGGGYRTIVRDMFSAKELKESDFDKAAIRITDNKKDDYYISTFPATWLKSNPFGYAKWFELRQQQLKPITRTFANEDVKPLPNKRRIKTVLQRVVQLLKRHRDIMYNGRDDKNDKPISIIITTLAAEAYKGESNMVIAFRNVVNTMTDYIEEREINGRTIKYIANPVNKAENFADKWSENPQRQKNFYEWVNKLKHDMNLISGSKTRILLESNIKDSFGKDVTERTFSRLAEKTHKDRENGNLKMKTTGVLSAIGGTVVATNHNFYGSETDE